MQTGKSSSKRLEEVGSYYVSSKERCSAHVALAYMCGLEMLALTEKQQERVQVCEQEWVRRI